MDLVPDQKFAPNGAKECRNRPENPINRKRTNFCFETTPPKNSERKKNSRKNPSEKKIFLKMTFLKKISTSKKNLKKISTSNYFFWNSDFFSEMKFSKIFFFRMDFFDYFFSLRFFWGVISKEKLVLFRFMGFSGRFRHSFTLFGANFGSCINFSC